jgi:hypothetical protein
MGLLSFMTLKKNAGKAYLDANYCVLNTTANLQKAFPFFQRHNGITSYLDNDASGKKSYQILLGQFEKTHTVKNGTKQLQGPGKRIKDVNDYLILTSSQGQSQNIPSGRKLSNR